MYTRARIENLLLPSEAIVNSDEKLVFLRTSEDQPSVSHGKSAQFGQKIHTNVCGNTMDSFIHINDISRSGENSSCLQDSRSATFDLETITLTVQKVLGLPKNGVGFVSCVGVLVRDLKECASSGNGYPEWDSAFRLLKSKLETINTESQDRILARSKTSQQSKLLLSEFGNHLSRDSRRHIRQIRAKMVMNHVCRRQVISERLASLFVQLISGRNPQLKDLAACLTCDRMALSLLRANYAPESDCAELMTSLIAVIDTPIAPPPVVTPQQIVSIVHTSQGANLEVGDENDCEDTKNLNNEGKRTNEVLETTNCDVIGNLLWETEHARPREFAGISNTWDFLQPQELELAVGNFAKDLDGQFGQESLASFLAISTRTRPKEYKSIPLDEIAGHSLWIDLNSGHVLWKMEAVIDRQRWRKKLGVFENRSPVRIPLPEEVSSRLQALQASNPSAINLGELFGGNLSALEASTKIYLKNVSTGNHRLTLGRLSSSLARYLLNICKDEAYASLLGIDFRVGTPSNFNYCSFRANRINSILREAYLELGLSGEISIPVSIDVGSRYLGALTSVDTILKDSLQDALATYEQVKRKLDTSSISAAHTTISTSMLRAMCITTGHRESDSPSFAMHTIDLHMGLALISDKLVSPYHHARPVPIPSMMLKWMRFYQEWLAHIRYRYLSIDRRVAQYVDSILASMDKRADGPIFFSLSQDGEIRGLRNADIAGLFNSEGLEGNAGRHWVENILRESDLDSAVIMGWAGHSAIGQEAYGYRSALDPETVSNAVRTSIDRYLDTLNLPHPPSFKSRKPDRQVKHQHDFTPGRFGQKQENIVGNSIGLEECPFEEMTLANSRKFVKACQVWLSTAPDKSIGSIATSLIVNDGIVNRDELLGATAECIWGRVYQDADAFFVDSVTHSLGIRRAWLSPYTVALSAQINAEKVTDDATSSIIDDYVANLFSKNGIEWQGSPLDRILELVRAFYSLRLPGAIRGWMFGDVHARTSRPELLARHRYNLVEHPRVKNVKGRSKSRRDISDKFITELILQASDTTEYRGREETRLRALHRSLAKFEDVALDTGVLEVKLRYAIHLTKTVDSPATVKRYYYSLRHFIEESCATLDSLDDIAGIEWEAPVTEFRNLRVATSDNSQDPALTALNHFLRCFGIDLITIRRFDPAASARRYTDYPSKDEICRAVELVHSISSLAPSRAVQAALALKIMAARYVRWFEVSRMRISDISTPEHASIVISHEAVGTHKSDNADRIHCGIEQELAAELSKLASMRGQQFDSDLNTFLFCDQDNNHSVSQSDELRRHISDSLWSVTGSDFISPHCSRRLVPIALFNEFLSLESRCLKSPLALRQFLYSLAGNIGHGDPLTTISHYICGIDKLRHQWVAQLLSKSQLEVSKVFLASVVSLSADTLRARVRRNSPLARNEILDDFDVNSYPAFVHRMRKLSDYLVNSTTTLEVDPRESKLNKALASSVYMASLLLGKDEDLAGFISQIDESSKKRIDRGLSILSAGLGKTWGAAVSVSPASLFNDELFLRIAHQITDLYISTETALAISRSIVQPNSAWMLFNIDDALMISKILDQLSGRLVTCVISRPKSKAGDSRTFAIFHADKHLHRKLDSRWFPRGCMLRIQFIPEGAAIQSLPALTPITTFMISAVLISKCASTLGGFDE